MVIDMVRLLFSTHDSIFSSLNHEEEELLPVARLSQHDTPQYFYSSPNLLSALLFRFFFALHYAQLFMHISQIVRKQMNSTKRNERNTWERAAAGRELMKIWTGNNITHRQTKCVPKRLSKTEENKNKHILSWIIQGQWGGPKQKKRTTVFFFFWDLIYPKGSR